MQSLPIDLEFLLQELQTLRQEVAQQRQLLDKHGVGAAQTKTNAKITTTTRRRLLSKLAALGVGGAATVVAGLALPTTAQAGISANFATIGAIGFPRGLSVTNPYNSGTFGLCGTDSTTSLFPFNLYPYAGVAGLSLQTIGVGVVGVASNTDGTSTVVRSSVKRGVVGVALDTTGAIGVVGYGNGTNAIGVFGFSSGTGSNAGYFQGDVQVTNTLTAAAKSFKIDHPLDPTNQYLLHSCLESAELKNFYDGIVTLDEKGEAEVSLPIWFEALNKDLRYQLTCLGQAAPAYISQTVQKGTFKIAGGQSGQQICWQITGVRQDAYAQKYPLKLEVAKIGEEKGKYIHPEAFGAPEELRIGGEAKLTVKAKN